MTRRGWVRIGLLAAVAVAACAARPAAVRPVAASDDRLWQWDVPDGPAALAVRTRFEPTGDPGRASAVETIVWAGTEAGPRVTTQLLDLRTIGVTPPDDRPFRLTGGLRGGDGPYQAWAAPVGGHTVVAVTPHPPGPAAGDRPLLTVETQGVDGRYVHTLVFVARPNPGERS